MTKSREPSVLDRVYASLHQIESELSKTSEVESDDFLEGVRSGILAEKREALQRLHWIIDPTTEEVDMEMAGPLVRRLNEGDKYRTTPPPVYDEGPDGTYHAS